MFDASVAAWDMKRAYDSIRPVTAIPLLLNGKQIRSWGGPGKGTVEIERITMGSVSAGYVSLTTLARLCFRTKRIWCGGGIHSFFMDSK